MVDDLVEWLRLQLDEDERGALAAVEQHWRPDGANSCQVYVARDDGSNRTIAWCRNGYEDDFANSLHIARWDPARVLREVDAKRKILDEHHRIEQRGLWHKGTGYETEFIRAMCVLIGDDEDQGGSRWRYREHAEWPCQTVLFLAAIYSDRPGYREDWRPGDTPPDVNPA
jgi:hypothetical protein